MLEDAFGYPRWDIHHTTHAVDIRGRITPVVMTTVNGHPMPPCLLIMHIVIDQSRNQLDVVVAHGKRMELIMLHADLDELGRGHRTPLPDSIHATLVLMSDAALNSGE